jgi:hypothetical protein
MGRTLAVCHLFINIFLYIPKDILWKTLKPFYPLKCPLPEPQLLLWV